MFFNRKFLKEIDLAKKRGNIIHSDFKSFYIEMNKSNEEFLKDTYCKIILKIKSKKIGYTSLSVYQPGELFIDDLHIDDNHYENKGYGTEMLDTVKKIAEINKFNRIVGDLSEKDMDHMEKLNYFYSKEGFTVTYYEKQEGINIGRIELFLPKNR
ncbi:hypothetical protein ATZ33_01335 [Enterococcus silesiacus]|uniref:N-acetyltransferase domain-containing protein n=1 Tax=Enterococcus silesiacus TaxID=332949 RepID=A0A0S3K712_9ENTE|nr:GNAT family N-acetyltransferase [Enterococcus silesiacus]ALS00074.1 hypothetical protein ATZ33_01335 [Enterococcus silesiacus]OJG91003.1 hypothetical protein RV15_GL000999 [Enterococcus silesiacus]